MPGRRLRFDDWSAALRGLTQVAQAAPTLVVIDEFPYLLRHSPELPSTLQRLIDASRDGGSTLRLALCGSALSIMANLLTGAQALRGRATVDIVVGTFDYRDSARFWDIDDAGTAFTVHAVLGGTPGYRDLIATPPPTRLSTVDPWLAAGPLNPSSALFREDDYLLTEDRSLADRALYHAVVAAIAEGNTSQGAIAAVLGRIWRASRTAAPRRRGPTPDTASPPTSSAPTLRTWPAPSPSATPHRRRSGGWRQASDQRC